MSAPHNDHTPCFRRLGPADADSMYRLEACCFSLPWSAAQCRAAFAQQAFMAFGLLREEELVAYISFYHIGDEVEILNLAVLPTERRSGHGRRILQLVLQAAAKMGIQNVLLEVRTGNLPAVALYESCGFRRLGVRSRYYPDTNEDALIYGYNIPASI